MSKSRSGARRKRRRRKGTPKRSGGRAAPTRTHRRRALLIGVLAVAIAGGGGATAWYYLSEKRDDASSGPSLGEVAFNANCARCHGAAATGSNQGPPLVHDIYNPGHHGDRAFRRAVQQGARAHHWQFGDMPAQPQVTGKELSAIIRYVRDLQEAKGIRYRRHRM